MRETFFFSENTRGNKNTVELEKLCLEIDWAELRRLGFDKKTKSKDYFHVKPKSMKETFFQKIPEATKTQLNLTNLPGKKLARAPPSFQIL